MKYLYILSCLIFMNLSLLMAQNGNYPVGARSAGMSDATVAVSDLYALHHNQAGLGFIEHFSAGIYAENKYLVEGVNLLFAGAALPTKTGTFGISTSYFGYELYNELKIGLSFGKALTDKFSLGIQFDYFSTNISEYGNIATFTAEAGIQYKILKNLTAGAHIFNPIQTRIDEIEEPLPTIFRLGLAYEASEKVLMLLEAEKDLDFDPIIKGGLEYKISPYFHIRGGAATNPVNLTFGAGFYFKNMALDIAAEYHQILGITPSLSLTYRPHR